MQNKDLTISTARGIAIILVVYGHVIQRSMASAGADFFLNPAFKVVYAFHMPLFFLISGYLMALSLSRRSISEVFKSRCARLLVPYLSWSILGVLTNYVLGSPVDIADQLFLHPVIWFLFALFVLSGLLLCSIALEKRLGLIAFVIVYGAVWAVPYNGYCVLYFIKWFYLFFMAGYFAGRYGMNIMNGPFKAAVFAGASVLFFILVSHWAKEDYIYIHKMDTVPAGIAYQYLTGFLGIIAVLCACAYLSKTKLARPLDYIGVYSLDIYLVQRYIVEGLYPRLVGRMNIHFDFNSPLFLYVFAPLTAMAAIGLCLLVSNLLIRGNHTLSRLLFGR